MSKRTRKPTFVPESRRHIKFSSRVPRKLSDEKVIRMRELRAQGEKIAVLASMFDVHDTTAYKVCERITWRHIS